MKKILIYLAAFTACLFAQLNSGIVSQYDDRKNSSEPAIAINPLDNSNIIICNNYSRFNSSWQSAERKINYSFTNNSGDTWQHGRLDNLNFDTATDPSIDFDNNGNAYIGYFCYNPPSLGYQNAIIISNSSNGGGTWQYNTIAASNIGEHEAEFDKPFICIDKKNTSPYLNRKYISYTTIEDNPEIYNGNFYNIVVNYADGQQYSDPVVANEIDENCYLNGSFPITDIYGDLYLFFYKKDNDEDKHYINVVKSTNGGTSFNGFVPKENTISEIGEINEADFDFRMNSFPMVGIDLTNGMYSNYIYATWGEYANASELDKMDVFFARSSDGGDTWQKMGKINYEVSGEQFFPSITVDEEGVIRILYYDMPNRNLNVIEPKCIISFDAGETFLEDELFDEETQSFDITQNFIRQPYFIGDYIGITSKGNIIAAAWTANTFFDYQILGKTYYSTVINAVVYKNKMSSVFDSKVNNNRYGNIYLNGSTIPPGSSEEYYPQLYYDLSVPPYYNNLGDDIHYGFRKWENLEIFEESNLNLKLGFDYDDQTITAKFHTTLPLTITSNFEGAQNVGSYDLTWKDIKSYPGQNYSTTPFRAFMFEPTNQDLYNISASLSYPFDNTTWYFRKWSDESTNPQKTNVVVTSTTPNQYTAYYKGIQRSDNADAYTHNSQRKFIRSADGVYHAVYSSMGKVWYETKTGTDDWVIMNNVNPIVSAEAKNPSIVYLEPNYVAICYQENFGGNSSLRAVVYNYSSNQIVGEPYNLESSIDSYSLDNPIAIEFYHGQLEHLSYLLFVYKAFSSSGGFGPDPGLMYSYYTYNHSTKQLTFLNWNNITGTNINFSNPSLASCELKNYYYAKVFYLAYQEDNFTNGSSKIWYQTVDPTSSTEISHAYSTNVSSNSGYTKNYKPNLITLPGTDAHSRLTWIGERTTEYEVEGEEQLRQITEKRTVFRGSSGSSFWNFGNDVRAAVIQKSNNHQNYFVSWNQTDGISKSMNNTSFSTIRTINEDGSQIDVCNGQTISDLYGMIFNNSGVPYSFSMTNNLSSYFGSQSKETSGSSIFAGREGTVTKDNICFFYTIGDVEADGVKIEFKEITESTSINSNADVKQYLETEPFELNDNSVFIYSVQYGSTLSAENIFAENEFINYKVKLIDVNTNTILTVFDDITFNHENLQPYASLQYNVNTNGIGNKTVKLVLDIEDNFNAVYSVTSLIDDAEILQKSSRINVDLGENINVTEYDLFQNYPNPFNPVTTIVYQIPKDGLVTLKIYDILGREVKTLVTEVKTKGRYEVTFNAGSLASGLYIYEIKSGSYKASKKMTLIK